MSVTGLEVFDARVQRTDTWPRRLMAILDTQDRRLAYLAMRATLHALLDPSEPISGSGKDVG
jgi:hypothetical protein